MIDDSVKIDRAHSSNVASFLLDFYLALMSSAFELLFKNYNKRFSQFSQDIQHRAVQQDARPGLRVPLEEFPHNQKIVGGPFTSEEAPPAARAPQQGYVAAGVQDREQELLVYSHTQADTARFIRAERIALQRGE